MWVQRKCGAGEGNRTLVTCLGSKSSTIELHPHIDCASVRRMGAGGRDAMASVYRLGESDARCFSTWNGALSLEMRGLT